MRDHQAEVAAETQHDTPLPKRKKRQRQEESLQQKCIVWCRRYQRAHPTKLKYIVAQPERRRTLAEQNRDKQRGILGNAGHPELILIIYEPNAKDWKRVVFVEWKAAKGVLDEDQVKWRAWLEERSFSYAVVRSLDDLRRIVG